MSNNNGRSITSQSEKLLGVGLVLLLHGILGLLFLHLQQRANIGQRLLRQDKPGGDNGLATRNIPIPTAFLILRPVKLDNVTFRIDHNANRPLCTLINRSPQPFRILLDDREPRVNPRQPLVAQSIRSGQVR